MPLHLRCKGRSQCQFGASVISQGCVWIQVWSKSLCPLGYPVETWLSLNATEQKLPSLNLAYLTLTNPCYKDFDVPVILSVAFGFEAPSMNLCYEISLLSLPVSRRQRLLSLGPILCRGLANGPTNQHESKNSILGFICGQGECEREGL